MQDREGREGGDLVTGDLHKEGTEMENSKHKEFTERSRRNVITAREWYNHSICKRPSEKQASFSKGVYG